MKRGIPEAIGGLIAFCVMLVIFVVGMSWLISLVVDDIEEGKKSYEKNLGKPTIISGDTLQIIDYSSWDETYTLSNGIKLDKSVVEQNIIKQK